MSKFKKTFTFLALVCMLTSIISVGVFTSKVGTKTVNAVAATNTWGPLAGIDDLGRVLVDHTTVGQAKTNKYVGMFYSVWHGTNDMRDYKNVFNDNAIVAADPTAPYQYDGKMWPDAAHFAYWDKPLFGYYRSDDAWVVMRHVQMLADAGIDFLELDASNYELSKPEVDLLMRTIEAVQRQGRKAPQIVFMTHDNNPGNNASRTMMDELYNTYYSPTSPYYHPTTWFYWKGKPLIVGNNPSATISSFFTFRYPQWPNEPKQATNGWDWINFERPQRVNYNNLGEKEESTVSVAQNAGDPAVFSYFEWYGYAGGWNRSYHHGANDTTPGGVNWGYNFQEQWDNAVISDPSIIMVNGWNEWIAGNWQDPARTQPLFLVDSSSTLYSRDIEPMTGGYGDNYYMQLVNNVRRFKGIEAPVTPSAAQTVTINTNFSQWTDVSPAYKDYKGDTMVRNSVSAENKTYTDNTGRNDFDVTKIARDATNVYFYASTVNNITPRTDSHWMTLFLNVDGNNTNGWKGYDYVVNRTGVGATTTTLEQSTGGWAWTTVASNIAYTVSGNQMMLAIPRSSLGSLADPLSIQFKWADNWQNDGNILDFYLYGDQAPNNRFNYVYKTATQPATVAEPTPAAPTAAPTPQPAGFYRIEDNSKMLEYRTWKTGVNWPATGWATASDAGASGGTYAYIHNGAAKEDRYFGNTIKASFTGNGIRWITTTAPDGTNAEIFIDGLSQGKVTLFSPTTQKQTVAFEKYGLSSGQHEIIVRFLAENGKYYHDAFEYMVGSPVLPLPVKNENLALKASAIASTFKAAKWYATNEAQTNDNDVSTYWRATGGAGEWLSLDFGRSVTFNTVEFLQNTDISRISSYNIQYWNGTSWVNTFTGGSMLDNQVDKFTAVTASKVRLLVNSITANQPAIIEMKVFNSSAVNQLSQGRPVTSSTSAAGFEPAKSVDGDTATFWKASSATMPQWLKVDLGYAYNISQIQTNFVASELWKYKLEGSNDNSTWTMLMDKTGAGVTAQNMTDNVTGAYRYARITVTSAAVDWASIREFNVYGTSAETLLSGGKSATTSTNSVGFEGGKALDGNAGSYWAASSGVKPQWLNVDLGGNYNLTQIQTTFYANELWKYKIEGSNNNSTWTMLVDKTGAGVSAQNMTDDVTGVYRYVRITVTDSAGDWAALREFNVYGNNKTYLLSLNRYATASTNAPNAEPFRAVDGDSTTYWCASTGSMPQWLKLDLGSTYSLSVIQTTFVAGQLWKYKIEGSNDNSAWATLIDNTGAGVNAQTMTHGVAGAVRYIRITVTGSTTDFAAIREFNIFGSNQPIVASTGQAASASTNSANAYQGVDANAGTYWVSSTPATPQWFMVDLGAIMNVSMIKSNIYTTSTWYYWIEGSPDNVSWYHVVSSSEMNSQYMTDSINGSYRYLRMKIKGVSNDYPAIREFQVYVGQSR